MKKTIKAELVSLAHKILQLRDTADYSEMAARSRELHDKLTILEYAEKLEKSGTPTIGLKEVEAAVMLAPKASQPQATSETAPPDTEKAPVVPVEKPVVKKSKTPAEILAENQARYAKAKGTDTDRHRPDGTQFNEEEPLHEPVIEKIKDMWPEMTPEAAEIDKVIESIIPQQPAVGKNDSFEIGNEYGQTPIFEPKETAVQEEDEAPKNLNDKLKKGLKIGLNDKLSFIKHLFDGSATDYNRVLNQLETFQTATEARQFIAQMVKPDYKSWEGKEAQEERFIEIVESRYQ